MIKYQFPFLENDDSKNDEVSHEQKIEELNRLKEDDQIAFNQKAEELFIKILCELIEEFGNRLYKKDAINEMAQRLNVSPVTSKRYLDKHTTTRANFEIKDKLVRCKKCDQKRRSQIIIIKGKK